MMASSSDAKKVLWYEGDSCTSSNLSDDILGEGICLKPTCSAGDNDTTWPTFCKDTEEETSVGKLLETGSNYCDKEKPVFASGFIDHNVSIPFHLGHGEKIPYTINRYLRDYQREGIQFIYKSYLRSSGCILGDDMGLGKTVQVIGLLAALLHKTGTWEDVERNRPQFLQTQVPSDEQNTSKVFLIVAPLSVLYNWKDELDTWGYFRCVVVHGIKKEEELTRVKNGRFEIALTTYETVRLYLDQFNEIDWTAVIVDEAHKIKNPNSQITQAMKELRCKIRIGLTGTILQNNLEELWCVMDWVIPGCLGSLGHFKNKFSDPIEQGQRHSATKRALATGRRTVRALVQKISPCFIRRTKALIKEQLPKKDDRVVYCTLTDFQQRVYQTVLDTEDVTLLLRSSEKCDCQSGRTRRGCCYKTNSEGVRMAELYFSYLAILRKVANHAALLQTTAGTSTKQEKYVSSVCAKVFENFPDFVWRCKDEAFEALSDPIYSGKMKVLQKLLKFYLGKKNKVLVFSLSTKLLDVLESYCMAEGLDYSRLDGSTKSKERFQIVKDFNSSSHINLCLVSTMAGGLGLNFIGANVVVLFDPTWNPANDLQAIDRAYRIGQRRDVTVLRLISLGTIEEIIYLRQIYKQQLQCSVFGKESSRRYFEAVQGHDVHKGELFGIKNLFRLQTQGTCLTRKILEREGRVEAGVMTTRTHKCDEKEETKGEDDPGDSLTAEAEPKAEAARFHRGVLDFSSGSETDEPSADDVTRSAKASNSPGQMSLLQHGFSRLLERVSEKPESDDSGSDGEGSYRGMVARPESKSIEKMSTEVCPALQRNTDKSSPKLQNAAADKRLFSDYSDESEDFDLDVRPRCSGGDVSLRANLERNKKKQKFRFTEDIETFTSSEDEQKTSLSGRNKTGRSKPTSFTRLKSPPKSRGKEGNINRMLGGVQEVAYTHSNQRVVGGSKAEELISRAAARDVFQRKMYSQLPANNLLDSQETLPATPPETPLPQPIVQLPKLRVEHPVVLTRKSVHHKEHSTVIIGETPKAIRRQQLEEMAGKCSFSSVREFASEILSSSSARRVAWLRQYYASASNADLAQAASEFFVSPQTSSPPPGKTAKSPAGRRRQHEDEKAAERGRNKTSKCKIQRINVPVVEMSSDVLQNEVDEPLKKQKISASNAIELARDITGDQEDEGRRRTKWTPPDSTVSAKPNPEPPSTSRSFLTDLIGDTSILDDLLKPKPSSSRRVNANPRRSCKDIWDILDEGNEERINRLTDPKEVQRVCTARHAGAPARTESGNLWKTNDKFLWKR